MTLAAGLLAWTTAPAGAVSRLVRLYDFEDTNDLGVKVGLALSDAPHWYPIGRDPQVADPSFLSQPLHEQLHHRRGYPEYNAVRMDDAHAASGEYALLLEMAGGDVGAFLEVGALPVVPLSDYLVTARVRTEQLRSAGATVSAYFVDGRGRELPETRVRSRDLRTAGQWTDVSLHLLGESESAAWVVIEVQINQPEPHAGHPLGDEQVVVPDIDGAAWFDDIAVWQLPNLQIDTGSAVNTLRGEAPELSMRVRDLSGQRLRAVVTVYDDHLRPVARHERGIGAGAPSGWRWTPPLPGYGWYYVDLSVRDVADGDQQPEARNAVALLWLPEQVKGAAERTRFGVSALGVEDPSLLLVPDIVEAMGLGSSVISAWRRDTTLASMDEGLKTQHAVIDRLLSRGEVTLSLEPTPAELDQMVGLSTSDVLAAQDKSPEAMRSFLMPIVMRHGQRVHRWQVGAPEQADAFFSPGLHTSADALVDLMRSIAPGPTVVLPWRLDQSPVAGLDESLAYAVAVPAGVKPAQMGAYLQPWASARERVTLQLETLPASDVPQHLRARDMALRMVHAWEQGVGALMLAEPWATAGPRQRQLMPDPVAGVFVNTSAALGGRRVLGRMPVAPGVHAVILDGSAGGAMVLWNESSATPYVVEHYLGRAPVAVDLWGNRTPVEKVGRVHRLEVGRDPVFVEGIDAELAVFRAGFRLNEPLVESTQVPHERVLTLVNPWEHTITGTLTITGPPGWSPTPARHFFSIASGRTARLPVTLNFPVAEVAGEKQLTARAEFRAGDAYAVDVQAPLVLGLPGVSFDATLSVVPGESEAGGVDALVSAVVTNTGENSRGLYVFASLAGHPRIERSVPRLEPGESAVRTFRFKNAGAALAEHFVRTGLREMDGPAVLNHVLRLEESE